MLYDPSTSTHLKPWLLRTLEPICDAEPGALADYILALLKHNVPESEMRQELAAQLDEFLEKECGPFLDTLFAVLRTKTYMPYVPSTDSPPLQVTPLHGSGLGGVGGIPIPLDGLLAPSSSSEQRSRKRSNEGDMEDERPHKGPRLNHDGQFSRYGQGDGRVVQGSSGGHWGRQQQYNGGGMGMGVNQYMVPMNGMPMNGMGAAGPMNNGRRPQGYQPPDQKRGICRDYHNNGYCARGAMCKYSHGEDAVVPGQMFPGAPGMPFMPMFPGGMPFMPPAPAYDPHEARMDMRPRQHQRAPLLPRIKQEDGSVLHPVAASGELPVIQDLTPNVPPNNPPGPLPIHELVSSSDVDMQLQLNNGMIPPRFGGYNPMAGPSMNGNSYSHTTAPIEVEDNDDKPFTPGMRPPTLGRGGFRERGRGGRGTFGGAVQSFRPEKRTDKTLVVEKIPEEKLSLDKVNEWFKRFGTVTNVAIDVQGGKALVSFENHDEAHAAWKSEEAVFGNRFVKVFWHRPMEGHGQVGARMLKASAPLVANMSTKGLTPAAPTTSSTPTSGANTAASTSIVTSRKPSATPGSSATLTALAAKQQLLEQKIAEQKLLMASLDKASAEEKKGIMARLRELGKEMTQLTSSGKAAAVEGSAATIKQEEAEKLDAEIGSQNGTSTDEPTTTEDLKAKLEKLKAEAASLGLDSALPSSSATTYRGGFRGRPPRGRGAYYRGAPVLRGGPPRASMKLDNRPKKLLVKGVGEENAQALRDWYETTGQFDGVNPTEDGSGSYIVSFKSRPAAEQGLAKGSNIPLVGSVLITWYSGQDSAVSATSRGSGVASTSTKASTESSHGDMVGVDTESVGGGGGRSPEHLQEEEIVASGWGGDGDDGDGMGML